MKNIVAGGMMRALQKIPGIFIYIILIYFSIPVTVQSLESGAAGEKPEILSLNDAVRIALMNNHDYRIAGEMVEKAGEGINQAWGMLMPVLESEASVMKQGAETGFMSLSDGQNEVHFIQARLSVNPGIFYNTLKLTRKAYVSAKEEKRRTKYDVTYSVIKSYFDVLSASEMVRMRKDSIAALAENDRTVSNMFKAGNVTKYEQLQARVKLKSQEPLLLEAENTFRVSMEQFNYTLGQEGLRYTADPAVLEVSSFSIPKGGQAGEINRLISLALAGRPEFIQIKMKRDISEHKRNIAGSFYLWPTFSVMGYYGMSQSLVNNPGMSIPTAAGLKSIDMTPLTGNRDWQKTWQVRMAATYRWGSLLPFDPKRSEERELESDMKEADEEFLKLKRKISISIKSSYLNFITAYHTIISQRENVTAAEEGLRVARDSYRVGVIKNSDLLSAELDLTAARTGYITAVNRYYISLADLKKEIGADSDKIILTEK